MRSRKSDWQIVLLAAAWATAAHCADDGTARTVAPTSAANSFASLDAALNEIKRDPNLGGDSKVRTLKWTQTSTAEPVPRDPSPWIIGLFDYLGGISGLLLWVSGAAAVAVAAVWMYRYLRALPRPTHTPDLTPAMGQVLDLDIRPNSLPDDVSAAALALSGAGYLREALSLLYRASLSRAVNRFGVAIGPSLTEREALGVMKASLDDSRAAYFADLVMMRQRLIYAGEAVGHDQVAPLCSRFGDVLDPAPI
jgi:hypothetical protein